MRFSNANYLKAFPREANKPVKVEVVRGNVIEEAEQAPAQQIQEPEAGNVIGEAELAPEEPEQEGADNGD